ncbi:MAG: molybdopterin molybdotransferase MoeA [Deltaproteobacteria bacterium]|jgi:molybdopterin molybdotransferase|nr:molybdopterin molybdotransferase MoeA [Deltaproteobacteria bacterium]
MRQGITPAEALRIVLEHAPPLGAETTSVSDARGRVLAEGVRSARRLPPSDNSAMDGFAVRSADLASASAERPVTLEVIGEIPAGGSSELTLRAGEAARILTGAPVPPGSDAVVMQEDTARDGDRVTIGISPQPRAHIRDAGEDVEIGDQVLEAGALVGPAEIGMLASLGRSVVSVHRRPRVAILSGGDELVEPDGDTSGGRIVASNSYSIAAQCLEVGAEPVYLGIARDTPEDIERHLRAGLRADVIVSSAGVSVGDRDYVRGVLEKLGCSLLFWGVKMKPGYPLTFGRFEAGDGPIAFGLPGNPVSAMVTFEQFVRPALRKMAGRRSLFRPTVRARLADRLHKQSDRLHFVRVDLEREGDEIVARSTGNQSSGVSRSMLLARGLLIFPAEIHELRKGDTATVQILDEDFLAPPTPAFS